MCSNSGNHDSLSKQIKLIKKRVYVLNCINFRFCDGLFYGHISIFASICICPLFFSYLYKTSQTCWFGAFSDHINEQPLLFNLGCNHSIRDWIYSAHKSVRKQRSVIIAISVNGHVCRSLAMVTSDYFEMFECICSM